MAEKAKVNSTTSIKKEISTFNKLSNSQLSYTLADRTDVTSKYAHYFATFNMPYKNSNSVFYSGSTIATLHPELFHLNVDKIAIIPISENNYNEYIDGRSIKLVVPQWSRANKTVISSFFSDAARTVKVANSPINYFGPDNVAFLFSDDVNRPYTGTTEGGKISYKGVTTWDPTTDFRDRPSAIAYSELVIAPGGKINDYNTDLRPWKNVKRAVSVPYSYPINVSARVASPDLDTDTSVGYYYDIPVGFVCLDSGFIVLTHPDIVNNIPWTSGSTTYEAGYADTGAGTNIINGSNAGATSGTSRIVFTSTTSTLSYHDISIRYVTTVVCIAMPGQFFISKNPSWPLSRNLAEIKNRTTNFDSIFVTQIGLYNTYEQLIAVAKLDRPVEKTYDGLISFNLQIDI